MANAVEARLTRYGGYFLAWTIAGLFYFSQEMTRRIYGRDPAPWSKVLLAWMVGVYICAALTPAVLRLGRKWPIETRAWPSRTTLHLVFSAIFSVVQLTIETAVYMQLGIQESRAALPFLQRLSVSLVYGFHGNVLSYWAILGIQSAFHHYRRYQEREQQALRLELRASELTSQLTRAQLSALKMQLQPHFLFNTLNAITVLVRQRSADQAEEMLARLGDLLRWVLDDVEAQEVPLRRELEYVQLYLSIEQVRFADRLRVDISADPEVLEAAVPHMSLQPIVENAVRHGIGRRAAAGTIAIRASEANGKLRVLVQDDGPGFKADGEPGTNGIGLANTRARLEQLYGTDASLTIDDGGGASVTMTVPYHVAAEAARARAKVLGHAAENAHRR
jgi:two-component system, LytTR family, sensor kinase